MEGKYSNATRGQWEAVWNKHGGEDGIARFLRGETMVVPTDSTKTIQTGVRFANSTSRCQHCRNLAGICFELSERGSGSVTYHYSCTSHIYKASLQIKDTRGSKHLRVRSLVTNSEWEDVMG
jgi:hypothetical protein